MVDIARTRIQAVAKCDVVTDVRRSTIQALQFPPDGSLDLIVAGLCLHYLDDDDFLTALRQIHSALAPGGLFVMSQEHPLRLASKRGLPSAVKDAQVRRDGWVVVANSHEKDPQKSQREQKLKQKKIGFLVDHYLEEGPRAVRWMGGVRVLKHHRSMSSIINACIGAGLSIYLIDECHRMPMLSYEVLDSERVCVAHYNRRPLFLVLGAVKR